VTVAKFSDKQQAVSRINNVSSNGNKILVVTILYKPATRILFLIVFISTHNRNSDNYHAAKSMQKLSRNPRSSEILRDLSL
jgi:hypothetical protein